MNEIEGKKTKQKYCLKTERKRERERKKEREREENFLR